MFDQIAKLIAAVKAKDWFGAAVLAFRLGADIIEAWKGQGGLVGLSGVMSSTGTLDECCAQLEAVVAPQGVTAVPEDQLWPIILPLILKIIQELAKLI